MNLLDRKLLVVLLVAMLYVYSTLGYPDLARDVLSLLSRLVLGQEGV